MTNYEFFKSEIEEFLLEHGNASFAIVNNEVVKCDAGNCSECWFHNMCETCETCMHSRKKWLNSEYIPYSIPANTPIDTKVLVSSDGKTWYRRYFSHFGENKQEPYVCFDVGTTSWSTSDEDEFCEWRYCKLWKEDEEE